MKNFLELIRQYIKRWGILLFFLFFCIAIWLGSINLFKAELSMSINTEGVYIDIMPKSNFNLATVQLLVYDLKISGADYLKLDDKKIPIDSYQSVQLKSKEPSTISPISSNDGFTFHLRQMNSGLSNYGLLIFNTQIEALIPPQSQMIIGRDTIHVGGKNAPKSLEIFSSTKGIELIFQMKNKQTFIDIPHQISEIQNWEIISKPNVRKSYVQSGKITFLEKPDQQVDLYKGDDIEIAILDCKLHSLELDNSGIEYYLSGRVSNLSKSFGISSKSQMPTWYDKLSNMSSVRTLGALVTFLFGFGIHENIKRKK